MIATPSFLIGLWLGYRLFKESLGTYSDPVKKIQHHLQEIRKISKQTKTSLPKKRKELLQLEESINHLLKEGAESLFDSQY